MRAEGSAQAVAGCNQAPFEGFATKSGRTLEDDLDRARGAGIHSPIRLQEVVEVVAPPAGKRRPYRELSEVQPAHKPARPVVTTPAGAEAPSAPEPAGPPAERHVEAPADPRPPATATAQPARPATDRLAKARATTTRDVERMQADIRSSYDAGVRTVSAIARELHLSFPTVKKHMLAMGITPDDGRGHGAPRRPDLDHDAIVARYAAGETRASIAHDLHTSVKHLRTILLERGVELRDDRGKANVNAPRVYDTAIVERVRTLYGAGLTQRQVATKVALSLKAVRHIFGSAGIPVRTQAPPRQASASSRTLYARVTKIGAHTIRQWAAKVGLDVPERGLPPAYVVTAFEQAHQENPR